MNQHHLHTSSTQLYYIWGRMFEGAERGGRMVCQEEGFVFCINLYLKRGKLIRLNIITISTETECGNTWQIESVYLYIFLLFQLYFFLTGLRVCVCVREIAGVVMSRESVLTNLIPFFVQMLDDEIKRLRGKKGKCRYSGN